MLNVADEVAGVRLNVVRAIDALERLDDSEAALDELREALATLAELLPTRDDGR